MTEQKPNTINGQTPTAPYRENLPAVIKAVGTALQATNIQARIINLLPDAIKYDRFKSAIMQYLKNNPGLHQCDANSLVMACIDCAESGLLPDRVYGQAYIVPFKGQAQFMLGYKGMIQLAENTGKIEHVTAGVVFDTDEFEIVEGTTPSIVHKRDLKVDRANSTPVACYAIAYIKGARFPAFQIMSHGEVEKIRLRSFSGNSPAWKNSYSEMMRKTVIKRLLKTLPISITDKAGRFAAAEDEAELSGHAVHIDGDYTIEEGATDGSEVADSGEAATGEARGSAGVHHSGPGSAGVSEPNRPVSPLPEQPIKSKHSPRLKAALKASVQEEAMKAAQETPPHDPDTGEILEGDIIAPDEGPGEMQQVEVDTGPIEFVFKGKNPDLDKWLTDCATRLDTFQTAQQVAQFDVVVKSSRPWIYVKTRSPEAVKHFQDLVEMRKEALS